MGKAKKVLFEDEEDTFDKEPFDDDEFEDDDKFELDKFSNLFGVNKVVHLGQLSIKNRCTK